MKTLIKLLAVAIFVLALSVAVSAQTRVTFARGAKSKIVSGHMSGYKSQRTYVIRVRAGQTLRVEATDDSNAVSIWITDPNGDDASDAEANCNSRKRVAPTIAGDYKITVNECQKVDRWRGTYRIRFSVR